MVNIFNATLKYETFRDTITTEIETIFQKRINYKMFR